MRDDQLNLPFERPAVLLSPDEIYERLDEKLVNELREDRRLEFKSVRIAPRALGEYFSMWANSSPEGGILIIGTEDDGTISGCRSASQNQLNKIEKAGSIYCPDARYRIRRLDVHRADGEEDFLILIRVSYREDRVVLTVSGEGFIRVADDKKKLSEESIRELRISKREIDLEQEPSNLDYPADYDLSLVQQFSGRVREARKLSGQLTTAEILEVRRLGRIENGEFVPNRACTLLFSKDPLTEFPGCKLRFLRFDGEQEGTGERFNAIKDFWVEGPVPRILEEAEGVIESQLREFSRLGPDGKFYTAAEYPKLAWYEAIVNACVHRSYGLKNMAVFVKMFDDRLVIESPGAFPPLVTPDNIYDMHQPRNPHLMDAMFYLDFVKCAHEGTRRMRDTMAEMKLPHPEFEQIERTYPLVRVTLRNNAKQRKVWIDSDISAVVGDSILRELNEQERRAVNFIAEHGSINVSQLMRLTQKTWHFNRKILDGLVEKSILRRMKSDELDRDPKAKYVLKNGH